MKCDRDHGVGRFTKDTLIENSETAKDQNETCDTSLTLGNCPTHAYTPLSHGRQAHKLKESIFSFTSTLTPKEDVQPQLKSSQDIWSPVKELLKTTSPIVKKAGLSDNSETWSSYPNAAERVAMDREATIHHLNNGDLLSPLLKREERSPTPWTPISMPTTKQSNCANCMQSLKNQGTYHQTPLEYSGSMEELDLGSPWSPVSSVIPTDSDQFLINGGKDTIPTEELSSMITGKTSVNSTNSLNCSTYTLSEWKQKEDPDSCMQTQSSSPPQTVQQTLGQVEQKKTYSSSLGEYMSSSNSSLSLGSDPPCSSTSTSTYERGPYLTKHLSKKGWRKSCLHNGYVTAGTTFIDFKKAYVFYK